MNKKNKTKDWLNKHINDPFVRKAHEEGYRSRASFKLLEIQNKYRIIEQRQSICDLGAVPGGWSELAKKWVGPKGTVIACDLNDLENIAGVEFVKGDFTEEETQTTLFTKNKNEKFDVVISDMAPNTTGHKITDQLRSIGLVEEVLYFCKKYLKENGNCLVKVFQGAGFDLLVQEYKKEFAKVIVKKPKSSKDNSKEVYLIAWGRKSSTNGGKDCACC